jgi:predicted DCC family thiol-disulfide oxidoreductase YuxK
VVNCRQALLDGDGINIVYDGECPFCSNYVHLMRLKDAVGPFQLIDARERPELVAEARQQGFDPNKGMLVAYNSKIYVGGEAMTLLSLMATRSGVLNRYFAWIFSNKRRSETIYPALRLGRSIALKLLGRTKIGG